MTTSHFFSPRSLRSAPLAALILLLLVSVAVALNGPFPPGQICVVLAEGADIADVNERWGTSEIASFPEDRLYLLFHPGPEDLEEIAAAMAGDRPIEMAEPNWMLESPEGVRQMVIGAIGGTFADFEDQEMAARIGLDEAHACGLGEGILVAVLDTGVDPDHELFAGRLSPLGIDLVDNDDEPWEEANGLDDDDDGLVDGGYGHGSMVAGLVALVAPEATLLPIRILDDEGFTDVFRVMAGAQHAANSGARVINMSFGVGTVIPEILALHLEMCLDESIVILAGAGNENREEPPYYPAAFPEIFMVTALDTLDVKADFADYHNSVLVAAPGVGLRSAYPGNDWGLGAGCSFATPLVAGEVALLLGIEPELERGEVMARVANAVEGIYHLPGNEGYENKLGSGRIFLPLALSTTAVGDGFFEGSQQRLRVWPNPARGELRFQLPAEAEGGEILIYDVMGRLRRSLPVGEAATLHWLGDDAAGRPLPAGIYFARLVTATDTYAGEFILLR